MDDAFGHWISGFVDGEGSFTVGRRKEKSGPIRYTPRFAIAVRADDSDVILKIRAAFGGMGSFYAKNRLDKYDSPNANPQVVWQVDGKADLPKLVSHFMEFPLRAKKRRDFIVWAGAVREYTKAHPDKEKLSSLKSVLEKGREYQSNGHYKLLVDTQPELFRMEAESD